MQEYMLAMQPQKNLQCTPKGWQQIQKYFAGRKSWAMQGKGTFPFVQITLWGGQLWLELTKQNSVGLSVTELF